jgi:hypothetical protein
MSRAVPFLAIIFTALALVPGGAHLFALPNKITLAQTDYFIIQNIYRGWALLGIVLFAALAADIALAVTLRDQRTPFLLALAGAACVALTLVIFFVWTEPTNRATDNWTTIPADWAALRTQWEYSHAVNAAIMFAGLCAVTLSALTARR